MEYMIIIAIIINCIFCSVRGGTALAGDGGFFSIPNT